MKMELFSSVLNLDRWEQRSEKASTSAKDQQRELDIMSGTAAGIEVQIFQLKEMIEKLKSRSDEWTRDREDKLRDAAAQYEAAKAEFEKVENERGQADLSYDSAMTELRALNRGLQQLNEYLALARKDQVKHLAQVKADQVQVKRMQDHLDNIQEGNCPTCGQEIAAIALEKHCKEIQAEIAKLKKTQVPKSVVSQIVDLEAQIADASQQQSQFQDKADKAKDRLDFYQREASRLETILRVAQSAKAEYEVEANPYREQLEQLKRKNSALGVQKKDIDQKMIVKARQIERAKLWIKGFKDIRLNIIEEVTQELELATNAMLDEVGLPDWQVKYVIEQETKSGTIKRGLDVIVLSPYNRRSVRWETWSGGEGQRLRLIGALALSEVLLNHAGVDPSLEILDEPTRHLSSEGVRDLCDFLSARAQQLDRAIFYCDHQSVQSTRFSSVTTVTKKAFGSLIEQQS
jgi:DNA repair exonuclease SbcCD ATPase subunit